MEDGDEEASYAPSIMSSVMTAEGLADPHGFFIICCVVLIGDMNRGVLFPIMWPLVLELGGNSVWLGYAVGAFSFGRIIASPGLGKWSIEHGYSKTLITSTSIMLFGCIMFAQVYRTGSLLFLVFSQIVMGVGSATLGVTRAYVAEITATRQRTTYIAWLTAVQYGGFTGELSISRHRNCIASINYDFWLISCFDYCSYSILWSSFHVSTPR